VGGKSRDDDCFAHGFVLVGSWVTEDVGWGAVAVGEIEGDDREVSMGMECVVGLVENGLLLVESCVDEIAREVANGDGAMGGAEVMDGFGEVFFDCSELGFVGGVRDEVEGEAARKEVKVLAHLLGVRGDCVLDEDFCEGMALGVVRDDDGDKGAIVAVVLGASFDGGWDVAAGGNDK
jgi:hypothetical protein